MKSDNYDQEQEVSSLITYKYVLALTILAMLSIVSYIGVDSVIKTQETNAAVMNKAGHRRWLSQRVALYALHLADNKDGSGKETIRRNLRDHASRLEEIHAWLVSGDHPFSLGRGMSRHLHTMYFAKPHMLDANIREFIKKARELADAPDSELSHENERMRYIVSAAETFLLESIDAAVYQYQMESEAKIASLRLLETGALILTLLSLIAVAMTIFRPMARSINDKTIQIAQSEKRLKDITSTLGEGVFVADRERKITFVNPEAERLLGWGSGELIGKDLHMVAHSNLPSDRIKPLNDCPVCNSVTTGVPLRMIEDAFSKIDGTALPVDVTSRPIMEGSEVVGAALAFHDITQHKEAERNLRQAREMAEDATKLKDKFVSMVAHDLRSPFNSIMGFLRIIGDDGDNPLNEKQKSILRRVLGNGERLLRMIDELLNISRIRTGKIVPNPRFFDARMVASIAVSDFGLLASEKGVELVNDVQPGVRIYADFDLFNEVISNLVSNAIKFTKDGDAITIFVPDKARTTIAVKDTGIGIAAELLPHVFNHEVKTTTTGTAGELGTGLGLPFSHDIMIAHGGSLTVESEPGKGSVFYAVLPEVRPLALIVDDEEMNRVQLKYYLKELEIDVIEATDGLDALGILNRMTPNIIISDNSMPKLDGLGMVCRIKTEMKMESIPIIMVTSDKNFDSQEKAFSLGVNDYLARPINPSDLILRIKRALG